LSSCLSHDPHLLEYIKQTTKAHRLNNRGCKSEEKLLERLDRAMWVTMTTLRRPNQNHNRKVALTNALLDTQKALFYAATICKRMRFGLNIKVQEIKGF
jgi:hypothetical protein